jgi:antitoxin (DNA-binding transcriptional repressor) of toxin-antitoxin stability system
MSSGEITMSATEFKAKCLGVFDKLAARKLKRVTVLKRGKAVAVLMPPPRKRQDAASIFGFMRGTVIAPHGFDFSPLDEEWDAEKGILHR